jgi:hypothetical protein
MNNDENKYGPSLKNAGLRQIRSFEPGSIASLKVTTPDGGEYPIPIVKGYGRTVTVTLTQDGDRSISIIQERSRTSTTPDS